MKKTKRGDSDGSDGDQDRVAGDRGSDVAAHQAKGDASRPVEHGDLEQAVKGDDPVGDAQLTGRTGGPADLAFDENAAESPKEAHVVAISASSPGDMDEEYDEL